MNRPPVDFRMSSERPHLPPLEGKPLMVHLAVVLEHWPLDQPMPRALLSSPHGGQPVPDVPNFSWVEYGMRCGLPRVLRLLADRGLPAGAPCNAGVIDAYPTAAEAVLDAGWELVGHGLTQRALSPEDEEEVIAAALDQLGRFSGRRPRGWLGPGLRETFATAGLLARAGVDYVQDWVLDDLPDWLWTAHGPILAMPYTLELNDSVCHAVEHYPSDELHRRLVSTLEVLAGELATQPRMLTIVVHPHLLGVPHRLAWLARMLDLLLERDDTVFVTGAEVADWYASVDPPPQHGPALP